MAAWCQLLEVTRFVKSPERKLPPPRRNWGAKTPLRTSEIVNGFSVPFGATMETHVITPRGWDLGNGCYRTRATKRHE
jgi:hypothetical protein